ncbi:OLC1v1012264C1 [Oldenlandia corymbosa var. corymbosa]|uniref:non-specific serine/threonine protein kinase n=1 Tax=Oldenlandia corymbosa var. corymbosa TaxID=529605 RepID=A0AAV1DVR1_OLDCO|nr:OLC1v1012264C1 [Oldenlandia corymbosa var. corymbosa]
MAEVWSEDEGTEEYREGGYHFVRIGDAFKRGRYDKQKSRYVALKVHKSEKDYSDAATAEIEILDQIAKRDPEDEKPVVKLLDHFKHSGPNGQHVCTVLEYLGDNLRTLLKYSVYAGIRPLHRVKEICFHILVGLDYLHRQLSIIHTDLKPENIVLLCKIDPSNDPTKSGAPLILPSRKRKAFAVPEPGDLTKNSKKKAERTLWQKKLLAEADLKCKIVDLGNACWTHEHFSGEIQTRQYRCPEVILGSPHSTSADIWSFACVCFELATGQFLFDPHPRDDHDEDEDHLALIMELLGKMPRKIALGGCRSMEFFNKSGGLKHIRGGLKFRQLNKVLVKKNWFSEADAEEFAEFLLPMLDFEPLKRPTAAQCLSHPWMNNVPRPIAPRRHAPESGCPEKKRRR